MGCRPVFSRIFPLEAEGRVKGQNFGVKILDYDGLQERLDRQQELYSLREAEEKDREESQNGVIGKDKRFDIRDVKIGEYPQRVWKVLVKYYTGLAPHYSSASEAAYYWGVISQFTEDFYVYCSAKDHRMTSVADVVNPKSEYNDYNFVYRFDCRDGNVTVTKISVDMNEEEKLVEKNIEEDEFFR